MNDLFGLSVASSWEGAVGKTHLDLGLGRLGELESKRGDRRKDEADLVKVDHGPRYACLRVPASRLGFEITGVLCAANADGPPLAYMLRRELYFLMALSTSPRSSLTATGGLAYLEAMPLISLAW